MRTTDVRRRPLRAILLPAVAAVAVLGVSPADAADQRCGTQPRIVKTLQVEAVPGLAVRGQALVVEIRVTRAATGSPVAEADVSARLRSSHGPLFGGGTTDDQGLATIRIALKAELRPGSAVLASEAWAERTPGHWCIPAVREHGYVETTVDVR